MPHHSIQIIEITSISGNLLPLKNLESKLLIVNLRERQMTITNEEENHPLFYLPSDSLRKEQSEVYDNLIR